MDKILFNRRSTGSWFSRFVVVLMFIILLAANGYTFYLMQGYAGRIDEVSTKITKVQKAANSSISQMRSSTKSVKDAEGKFGALETKITDSQKQLTALEKSVVDVKEEIAALQGQENTEVETTVAELTKEIEQLRDKITYLMMNQLSNRQGQVQ